MQLKKLSARYRQNCLKVRKRIQPHYAHDVMRFPVGKWKKTDTLFLLGSGPSINDLTAQHWNEIRKGDSVGWNFWLYHDFVPTYYFFEIPRYKKPCIAFYELLKIRCKDYRNTPVILNDISQADERCVRAESPMWHENIPFDLLPHFYAIHRIGIPGKTIPSMKQCMHLYTHGGVFKKQSIMWYLVKRRASLAMLITFGIIAGYKRIVLCGIDYKNPAYFYDHPSYDHLPHGEFRRGVVNGTYDITRNPETVEEIVISLQREVLSAKKINLFVAHRECPLFSRLPLYPEFQSLELALQGKKFPYRESRDSLMRRASS